MMPNPLTVRLLSALLCALAGASVLATGQRPTRTPAPPADSTRREMSVRIIRNQRITCGETATLTFEACAAERTCAARRPSSDAIFALNDAIDREARSRARAACGERCGEIAVTQVENSWSCASANKLCATRTVRVTCESNEPRRTPVPPRGGDREPAPERTAPPPQRTPVPPRGADSERAPERTAVPPQRTPVPPERTAVPPQRTPVPPERTAVPPQRTRVAPERTPTGEPRGELRVARRRPAAERVQLQGVTLFASEDAKRTFLSKASEAATQAFAAPRQRAARGVRAGVAQAPAVEAQGSEFLVPPRDLDDAPAARQAPAGRRPGDMRATPPPSRGGQRGPTGEAGGASHASVPRFVCCEGFSLLKSALVPPANLFAQSNIVATLKRNERLLVFDDAPVPNGSHVLVRVQRTGGSLEMGWFPLFWLYAAPGEQKTDTLAIDASYMMIASQLRRGIAGFFYKDCDEPNPLGGRQLPQGSTSTHYSCGEYPTGNLSKTYVRPQNDETYKYLRNVEKEFKQVEEGLDVVGWYVAVYDLGDGDIDLSIPLYLSRRQFRSDEPYTIADLDVAKYQSDPNVSTRTYSRFPPAQADVTARVHPMDWYFRPRFPPTSQPQNELWFDLEVHLPGVEILAAPFHKVVVLESQALKHRVTETKTISLGGVRVDEIPIRVTGRLKRAGGLDQVAAPGVEAPFVTVEFTDVSLLKMPQISFPYDIEIEYYYVDGLHERVIGLLTDVLEKFVLKNGKFKAYLWEKFAIEGELETMLLKTLVSLQPELTQAIPDPRKSISNGCDRIFPSSQKTTASPFFGLYQECRSVVDSIVIRPFVNKASTDFDAAKAYARVNEGGLDWSFDEDKAQWEVLTPPGDAMTWVDRPGWSKYRPRPANNQVNNPGAAVRSEAQARANEHYWPILQCIGTGMNRVFNYDPSAGAGTYANRLQTDCLEAGVGAACKLFGEGDDLLDMWQSRWGVRPDTHEYTRYCLWARHLKDKDRPKFKGK